jgi:hypothetical protein
LLADPKTIVDLAKAILPHHGSYIDQFGIGAVPHLLEEVETKLLTEIMKSLDDSRTDLNVVQRAFEIQRAAEKAIPRAGVEVPDSSLLKATDTSP